MKDTSPSAPAPGKLRRAANARRPVRLSDRYPTAVVTGVTSGLGKAFCDMLLAEGVEVWGTSRDRTRIPHHPRLYPVELDLANGESVGRFFQEMESLIPDTFLLVNNAGSGIFNRFDCLEPQDIGEQLRVLLHGPVALCHAFTPHMLARGSGAVVNVSSLAAQFPLPYFSLYNAAKAGLSHFSKSLQTEFHGTGVRVIDFQPGDYRTGFNDATAKPEELELEARMSRAWKSLEINMASAPAPVHAAQVLRLALLSNRQGTVCSGDFFQTRLAPFLSRFVPWNAIEAAIRLYYRI